jgi:hypothetical protein
MSGPDLSQLHAIIGEKLLSLKPVVRTQRSPKRVGLAKRQNHFKDSPCTAMKCWCPYKCEQRSQRHILLRPLLYQWLEISTWLGLSFLNVFTMRSEIAVTSYCVLLKKSWSSRPTVSTAYKELLHMDSRSVLLSSHFAVKSPRYCSGETQEEKYTLIR